MLNKSDGPVTAAYTKEEVELMKILLSNPIFINSPMHQRLEELSQITGRKIEYYDYKRISLISDEVLELSKNGRVKRTGRVEIKPPPPVIEFKKKRSNKGDFSTDGWKPCLELFFRSDQIEVKFFSLKILQELIEHRFRFSSKIVGEFGILTAEQKVSYSVRWRQSDLENGADEVAGDSAGTIKSKHQGTDQKQIRSSNFLSLRSFACPCVVTSLVLVGWLVRVC